MGMMKLIVRIQRKVLRRSDSLRYESIGRERMGGTHMLCTAQSPRYSNLTM